jgi:hypothetical protein
MRTFLISLLALLAVPAATAAGPWLGTGGSGFGYTTAVHGQTTTVRNGSQTISLSGRFGVARVTLNGGIGGLSANGRVLVLGERFQPTGELRAQSAFAVLSTKPLALRRIVELKGDFGFDALAPDGSTLYLIQHVSAANLTSYRVRAYDLRAGTLLTRVIADKRQRTWLMNGYPISRATSADGRWVYTLYANPDNYPFVHALDTTARTAVCVGLPIDWTLNQQAINSARLRLNGQRLLVGGLAALDTRTFQVVQKL